MMVNIYFSQPYWFSALVFPLLWLWLAKQKKWSFPKLIESASIRYPALSLLDSMSENTMQPKKITAANILMVLFLVLIVLALAQPMRLGNTLPTSPQADPVDLILVVNTSVSMALKDYTINGQQLDRMAMAQLLLQQLVEKFKGRKIALVILGRPPSIWLPLTTDFELVKKIIGRLKTTLGGRNSDISETLALIQQRFSDSDSDSDSESDTQKIVLLLSDGYEQLGAVSPELAVKDLLKHGFKLHSLALGSITKPDFSLGKGHLLYQPSDIELMTRLAKIGEGKVEHANDLAVIDRVLENISIPLALHSTEQQKKIIIPMYQYPLALSLIVLMFVSVPASVSATARVSKIFNKENRQ